MNLITKITTIGVVITSIYSTDIYNVKLSWCQFDAENKFLKDLFGNNVLYQIKINDKKFEIFKNKDSSILLQGKILYKQHETSTLTILKQTYSITYKSNIYFLIYNTGNKGGDLILDDSNFIVNFNNSEIKCKYNLFIYKDIGTA